LTSLDVSNIFCVHFNTGKRIICYNKYN